MLVNSRYIYNHRVTSLAIIKHRYSELHCFRFTFHTFIIDNSYEEISNVKRIIDQFIIDEINCINILQIYTYKLKYYRIIIRGDRP